MVHGAFCLSENICRDPARLTDFGQKAQNERSRIDALTHTSETRRGMRYGMLGGMVAGACLAHAATLPYDVIVGSGSAILPATYAYHRAQLSSTPSLEQDPFVIYGAPRGLLGPIAAAAVGFIAGTSKVAGMLSGAVTGFVTSPILLLYGGHAAEFKAHIKHHRQLGGKLAFRLGHAGASLTTAAAADALRLPSLALKAVCPMVGLGIGACVGSLYGLRSQWPGELSDWVQAIGRGASATSQQGIVVAFEMAYLWYLRQVRVGP